jgi:hypothetical protein
MTLTVQNRPTKAGIYHLELDMSGSRVTLAQAQQLIKNYHEENSVANDGKALIGVWKTYPPKLGGKAQYLTMPPQEALFDTLQTSFMAGAARAAIPAGSPYVQKLYTSYCLLENLQTPANWKPQTTIVDANGNPIRETSTDGRTLDFKKTADLAQPQDIRGFLASQQNQPFNPMIPGLAGGIGQADPDMYGLMDNGAMLQNGFSGELDNGPGFVAQPAIAPIVGAGLWAVLKPVLITVIKWTTSLVIGYLLIRGFLKYVVKMVFQLVSYLYYKAKRLLVNAAEAIMSSGLWLVPVILGGAYLIS